MRKTIFTLFTALCITSVINVAKGQCVITAVPDPTAGYTPTQIVNGNFDEEPWMVFTYNNVTYTTCKDDKDFNSPSDDENGYAQNIVFNGVDGGWNTTDRYFWRSSLFEYTNTNSGTHDYIHNSSIPGTDKYVEMNNFHSCMLYQDLTTYSHDVIRWTLKHAVTTNGNDYQPIRVEIGAPNRDGQGHIINASGWANDLNPQINLNTKAIYRYNGVTDKDGHTSILGFGSASDLQYLRLHNTTSDQRNGWWTAQGIYLIPEGQTVTRFGFISETATNNMGNLLDDLTFTTIIGGLTASYGENGSIVVCGFWGEDDASKHLIIDINNIPHEVDMTAVTGQHFTLTVPEECIGGTVTSIAVYHEDYPGADIEISVNQPISVTAEDVNEVYDGVHSWGITAVVTEPATGYTLTYGASYNDCSLAISPTFMEPGTHYVYYTVSAPGYTTEKRKATVFIDKLPFWNDITITPPTPVTGLIYDRHKHTLITAGSATGGKTMAYAEGTDDVTAPTDGWSTELPVSKLWGNHYIWYKVLGDELHKDSDPGVVTTYIQEPPVYNLNLAIDEVGMGEMHVKASIFSEDFNSGELDLTDEWTNDATYPWLLEGNSLRSGNRNHDNSSSTLRASFDFTHDGSISFRYRVSSENCCDKGYFRIDGATKLDQLSGSVGWTTGTFAVTSGTHTFEWQYTKDVSVSSGDDGFFIDDIILFENLPFASSIGLEHGTIVDLAASANEAYSFVNWTSNNVVVSTEPTYMITITKDTVLTANFQKDFEGAGTEDNPYLIPSTEIWNRLATKVNSGTNYSGKFFRQTADISVTTMVGTNSYPFCGTYDGYNHTLTVDYNTTEGATGPFRYTLGATIKNLHTAGTITTSGKFAGGLIAFAYDANTITNCHSSVYITSSVSGDGTHGGFIGDNESSSTVTTSFEGCVFDGKLLGSNTNCCGGFVGWGNGNVSVNLTNCLFAPQEVTISGSDSYTFARTSTSNLSNISTTNCYYTQLLGGAQGKQCYSVTAGTAVTVAAAGTPSATYDVSGLAFYGTNGFTFNGVRYGGNGDAVSLNLTHADAPAGHSFSHYSVNSGTLTGADNPYSLTMPANNVTVDATYIINTYTLTLAADGNGNAAVNTPLPTGVTGNQDGTYTVDYGTEVTIVATPSTDYHFVQWQDDNSDNPRTVTVTEAATYTATFALDEYRIDSIPTSWQVKIGEGAPFAPTPYGSEHPDSGYVMIPVGTEFVIIPSDEQKHLVSKLELIDKTPLTFEAKTANTEITFTAKAGATLEYSLNGGNWTPYSDPISLTKAGDKVSFRGDNTAMASSSAGNDCSKFSCTGSAYVYGNVMSLLSKTGYPTATSVPAYAFCRLFSGCANIYNHETKALILPATTLGDYCYAYMFNGCTNLTSAPVLPAMTMANDCYANMFFGCAGLTTAPALPATSLAYACYQFMFSGCTNLVSAPELPATTLAGCCYMNMFSNCTGLTTVPYIPATTLVDMCCFRMFMGCTNLNSVTCLATDISATNCTAEWLDGVFATGTFTKAASTDWSIKTGTSGIPSNWITIPVIPGAFSVSSTKKVYFSQGNLKYSNGTWSFHTNQYDRCFTSVGNVSSSYNASGTFDIFGWGTSGYDHGAVCYQPWSTNTTETNYNPYGSATANLYDGNGKADWGYNAISNGGNTENQWRTLTTEEWQYLVNNHTKGWSTVNGVNGYVIRPDGVSTAVASSYTTSDWATQEAAGSVFLPAAGDRNGTTVYGVGSFGTYWSSTFYESDVKDACCMFFDSSDWGSGRYHRFLGNSVRLVRDAE